MKAYAVPRVRDAFSLDKPSRRTRGRKPVKLEAHLNWIRSLPSLITGRRGSVECAHVSMADPSAGKPTRGKGQKADDFYVVPLSAKLHAQQHKSGEAKFWTKHGLDPVKIAMALYVNSGDDEAAEAIIRETI